MADPAVRSTRSQSRMAGWRTPPSDTPQGHRAGLLGPHKGLACAGLSGGGEGGAHKSLACVGLFADARLSQDRSPIDNLVISQKQPVARLSHTSRSHPQVVLRFRTRDVTWPTSEPFLQVRSPAAYSGSRPHKRLSHALSLSVRLPSHKRLTQERLSLSLLCVSLVCVCRRR